MAAENSTTTDRSSPANIDLPITKTEEWNQRTDAQQEIITQLVLENGKDAQDIARDVGVEGSYPSKIRSRFPDLINEFRLQAESAEQIQEEITEIKEQQKHEEEAEAEADDEPEEPPAGAIKSKEELTNAAEVYQSLSGKQKEIVNEVARSPPDESRVTIARRLLWSVADVRNIQQGYPEVIEYRRFPLGMTSPFTIRLTEEDIEELDMQIWGELHDRVLSQVQRQRNSSES